MHEIEYEVNERIKCNNANNMTIPYTLNKVNIH